jgi:hypothetical protein
MKSLPLETAYLPDGITGRVELSDNGMATVVLTRGDRCGIALFDASNVSSLMPAINSALKQLKQPLSHPALGQSVTKIDFSTGEFWLNEKFGPFRFVP